MSAVTREKCVLKLVYPGHFVELHQNPITAAEVMKKHPRHFVTRPDVFKFPWIVVRPDSVLKPGRVFFVVPYHTIHRLLQEKGSQDQSFLQEAHIPDHSQDHLPRPGRKPVFDSSRELTPEHIGSESFFSRKSHVQSLSKHDQSPEQKYPIKCSVKLTNFHRLLRKQSQNLSQNKERVKPDRLRAGCLRRKCQVEAVSEVMNSNINYHDEPLEKSVKNLPAKMKTQHDNGDQPPKKRYPVEKWPNAIANYKDHQPYSEPQPQVNSVVEATPFCHTRQHAFDTKDLNLQLKSCLKKHEDNGASKPRGLRVTFAFPIEGNRKILHKKMERL